VLDLREFNFPSLKSRYFSTHKKSPSIASRTRERNLAQPPPFPTQLHLVSSAFLAHREFGYLTAFHSRSGALTMPQGQRMRQSLGEASTPGSARKKGRPSGKSVAADMGPKRAGKRLSAGGKGKGKRVSTGSAIERMYLCVPYRNTWMGAWDVDEREDRVLMMCV
jgi:hypothetical protein